MHARSQRDLAKAGHYVRAWIENHLNVSENTDVGSYTTRHGQHHKLLSDADQWDGAFTVGNIALSDTARSDLLSMSAYRFPLTSTLKHLPHLPQRKALTCSKNGVWISFMYECCLCCTKNCYAFTCSFPTSHLTPLRLFLPPLSPLVTHINNCLWGKLGSYVGWSLPPVTPRQLTTWISSQQLSYVGRECCGRAGKPQELSALCFTTVALAKVKWLRSLMFHDH